NRIAIADSVLLRRDQHRVTALARDEYLIAAAFGAQHRAIGESGRSGRDKRDSDKCAFNGHSDAKLSPALCRRNAVAPAVAHGGWRSSAPPDLPSTARRFCSSSSLPA